MVHSLEALGKGGFAVPGGSGCRAFCASPDAGLLCVARATSLLVFSWVGGDVGAPTADSFTRVAEHALASAVPGAAAIVRATLVGAATVCLSVVRARSEPAAALAGSAERGDCADAAVDLADTFFPFGGGRAAAARSSDDGGAPRTAAVAAAAAANDGDAELAGNAGAGSDEAVVAAVSAASTHEPLSEHDAGARLSFVVLHAWTGTLLRVLDAGLAPPLDADGALSVSLAALAGAPCAEAVGGAAAAAAAGVALLAAVGATADSVRRAVPWGTVGAVEGGGALLAAALPTAGEGSANTALLAFSVDALGRLQSAAAAPSAAAAAPASAASAGTAVGDDDLDVDADRDCDSEGGSSEEDAGGEPRGGGEGRDPAADEADAAGADDGGFAASRSSSGAAPLIVLEALPLELVASPLFPYVVSVHGSGAHVHSARTGALLQSVRVAGTLAHAVCAPDEGVEVLFLASPSGVVLLRSLPAVVQAAALLSARPPHFEEALALCADGAGGLNEEAEDVAEGAAADAAEDAVEDAAGDGADGGGGAAAAGLAALARKVRGIRRQYGYALWSQGDFAAGLAQLSLAREPVERVLALFPPLGAGGGGGAAVAPGGGSGGTARRPGGAGAASPAPSAPELIDALLPPALAPLVGFLALERERRAQRGAPPDAQLDERLIEALLWLRNHWTARAAALAARDAAAGEAARATRDRYSRALRALLRAGAGAATGDAPGAHGASELVAAYARALGAAGVAAGDADLVALWAGRGAPAEAADVLAAAADEALAAAEAVGYARVLHGGEGALRARAPIAARAAALVDFCAARARADPALALAHFAPALAGARGTEGLLLALAACARLREVDALALLDDVAAREAPDGAAGAPLLAEQAELWLLTGARGRGAAPGEALPARLARLWREACGDEGKRAWHAPALAAAGIDAAAHLTACAADAAERGAPRAGWARHVGVALLEARCLAAEARGGVVGARAAGALAAAYIDTLRELGARAPALSGEPPGLAREFRVRLLRLLRSRAPLPAEEILRALRALAPQPAFAEEAVALFERLGAHARAVDALVRTLGDFDAAEAYCARVHAAQPDAGVYALLLAASGGAPADAPAAAGAAALAVAPTAEPAPTPGARLLREKTPAPASAAPGAAADAPLAPPPPDAVERAVALLVRTRAATKAADALSHLPPGTPLSAVRPLVEATARASSDAAASVAAARAVASVAAARARADLAARESLCVQIDKAAACAVCKRRVGSMQPATAGGLGLRPAPFRVYPNSVVVHAACAADAQRCPVSGEAFGSAA
jgi:hypothetical protein